MEARRFVHSQQSSGVTTPAALRMAADGAPQVGHGHSNRVAVSRIVSACRLQMPCEVPVGRMVPVSRSHQAQGHGVAVFTWLSLRLRGPFGSL